MAAKENRRIEVTLIPYQGPITFSIEVDQLVGAVKKALTDGNLSLHLEEFLPDEALDAMESGDFEVVKVK